MIAWLRANVAVLALAGSLLGWLMQHAEYHGRMEGHFQFTDGRVDDLRQRVSLLEAR